MTIGCYCPTLRDGIGIALDGRQRVRAAGWARPMRRRAATSFLAAALASLFGSICARAEDATCPAALKGARQLVVVTTANIAAVRARLQRFERSRDDDVWRVVDKAQPAVVGSGGLAWSYPFRAFAREGEPIKVEGDKRTPAGVYKIGRSFGFAPSSRTGHLILKAGETICVDDPASPAYNTIASRATIGPATRGEDMHAVDLYRRGLVIDYPTDAAHRAGSCIFIHVWRAPGRGTAGCVALPEAGVAALQEFARDGAAIAILPLKAFERFRGCLPAPQ